MSTEQVKESRADFLTRVHRELVQAIKRDVPEGLGAWQPAWEIVEGPSLLLHRISRDFEEGTANREAVIQAGIALRDAWRRAGELYVQAREI